MHNQSLSISMGFVFKLAPYLILLLLPFAVLAKTQSSCSTPESKELDHMLGHWYGVQYVFEDGDSVSVGTTELTVTKVLDGCANKEIMDVHGADGKHIFNGMVLRSYDEKKEEWRFTEVDDRGRHFFFTSKKEKGIWNFYADRERNGRKYILQLSYPKVNDNHFKQIFARSYDNGETWEQGSHIDFYRDKPHPH